MEEQNQDNQNVWAGPGAGGQQGQGQQHSGAQNPPPQQPQQPQQQYPMQQPLPNGTAVLVLGILSIVTCILYGIIGIILGIIALSLASKDQKLYEANPQMYTPSSFNNLKAGKICGIIGLILSVLMILYVVFILLFAFSAASPDIWDL